MLHGDARGDSPWGNSAAYGSWRGPMSQTVVETAHG